MLWEIDIHPADGEPDRAAERVAAAARELGLAENLRVATARGYLLQGSSLSRASMERLASGLLADTVVERFVVGRVGDAQLQDCGLRHPEGTRDCGLPNLIRNPQSAIRKSSAPWINSPFLRE